MTAEEFKERVAELIEAEDHRGLLQLAKDHLDAVAPDLTPDEYEAICGGPMEWASMCERAEAWEAERDEQPAT